jgi:hypothetical protein
MQHGTTITLEVSGKTLKNLHRAMGMLTCGVVLLHDKECLHTAACT